MHIRPLRILRPLAPAVRALRPDVPPRWSCVLLLLFLSVCCPRGPVCADGTAQRQHVAELLVSGRTRVPQRWGDPGDVIGAQSFMYPFAVGGGGVVVVFAEAHYTVNGRQNVGIVAKYTGAEGGSWAERVTGGNGDDWRTQMVLQKLKKEGGYVYKLGKFFSAVLNNKIYLLVVTYKRTKSRFWRENDRDWSFDLVVGEIKTDAEGGKTIMWDVLIFPPLTLTQQFKNQSLEVLPYGGSAFLTSDGGIVFFMRTLRGTISGIAIVHVKDKVAETDLYQSYVEVADDCYSFAFFGWGHKIIMLPVDCFDGSWKVRESADMGATWTEVVGAAARVWDNLQGKEDFTTATIGNKSVLLFTQSKTKGDGNDLRNEIHLFFTDGNRMHEVGPIVTASDYISSGGLLYTNGELFLLHQKWATDSDSILLTRLTDKLEGIKSVLKTWAERDAYLSRPCEETAPRGAPVGTLCVTPMPTDGLVGFLSNHTSENTWHDEYLYLNATVRGGTKVDNGFVFKGTNAGARWTVGQRHLGKRYNFVRHGLTVVATVNFLSAPPHDSPLLTVGGVGYCRRLGLWYRKNKQWKVRFKRDRGATHTAGWVTNKAYRVALAVQNSSVSAYVDGTLVGALSQSSSLGEELLDIQHVFIGGYENDGAGNSVSPVTVTNVFFYNRLFNAAEMASLSRTLGDGHSA